MYDDTFFQCLQITRSNIRLHIQWSVSLVIADGYLIFLKGLYGYSLVNIFNLSPPRALIENNAQIKYDGFYMGAG